MSLSRIVMFIIGLVLALFGLYNLLQYPFELWHLIIDLILIIVGVLILIGRVPTL